MATGAAEASVPARRAKMLPTASTSVASPASRAQRTNSSRARRSSSVSVSRFTPPLGVAPMRASSMSEPQSRSALMRRLVIGGDCWRLAYPITLLP